MSCEANRVYYVFGLARNRRLEEALVYQPVTAKRLCVASCQPARVFRYFQYRTIYSVCCTRRVVCKAEHTLESANPRFVIPRSSAPTPPLMRALSTSISKRPRRG